MRPSPSWPLAAALVLAPAAAAAAPATWLSGDVVRTSGRWTGDGSRIVTDATVRTADGGEVVVSQLGGHADGYTMVVWHGQPALEPGQRVRIAAHPEGAAGGATAAAATRWVADEVFIEDGRGGLAPSVRTVTKKSGVPLYWAKSCVEVVRAADGTAGVADEQAAMTAAMATWNDATAACAYLDLVDRGAQTREVGRDFVNVIKFRDTTWCRPAVDGDPERCFSPQAAGVTTVTFIDDPDDPRDGEIVDADVELNNVTFRVTIDGQGTGTASCASDLANTLVHELGHLLGLEHTCRGPGDPERVDHTGAAVPLCTATSDPVITEATMYPYQECGETKKASPSPDDVQAICMAYPDAEDPGTCEPPDARGGGCCDAGPGGAGSIALALAALGLLRARGRGGRGRLSARPRR